MASSHSSTPTQEQRRLHFEVERDLANRLRHSTREERVTLVSELYTELYTRVPNHPRTMRSGDVEASNRSVANQLRLLKPFLKSNLRMVEFGAGSGALSKAVARNDASTQVTALEVCVQSGAGEALPPNFSWLHHDGLSVPLPEKSADIAFSYQVLEHMHPDDVPVHLDEVHRILKDGGVYVLSTPHEASGPHDVSRYFGLSLQTFHLREWSYHELTAALKKAGFDRVRFFWRGEVRPENGLVHRMILALETLFSLLPRALSVKLARRCLNNVVLVAERRAARP